MRPLLMLGLISVTCGAAFGQSAPQPASQGFILAGVAVQDGTNQPLNHVLVTIRGTGPRGTQAMYLTGADGGFGFSNLPAGKYQLAAMKEGYSRQSYLEDEQYSTAIVVGPALDSAHIVFPLKPPATLSGSISDDRGDPVHQAQVHLLKKSVVEGRLRVRQSGQKQTGSSGGFSFDNLTPGIYLLAVSGQPWYARNFINRNPNMPSQEPSPESGAVSRDVAYPLTYYAGTNDPASATPIEIREGAQAKLQITLHAVPAVHVNMSGDDIQNGSQDGKQSGRQMGRNMQAQVSAIGPDGVEIGLATGMSFMNGQGSVNGLAPGRYIFNIMSFNPARGEGGPRQMGSKLVDLTRDTTLDPSEQEKIGVSGKLTMEGRPAKEGGQPVTLILTNENGGASNSTTVGEDGSFQFETISLRLGRYTVQMSNAPGLYLKSIAATGAKYSNGSLDISGGDVQLAITAGVGAKQLQGLAVKDDKPFAGALVLLLPKNVSLTSQIRRDQSDSDGSFTLPEVAPGDYNLLAIDDGHQLAFQDPAVVKPYLPYAQAVTVPVDGQLTVKVTARQK